MTQSEVRVDHRTLKRFTERLFIGMGFSPEDAETGADTLVWANLRGVDSHGVLRMLWLMRLVDAGHLNPRPEFKILKETPAILSMDADRGLGAVTATFAMKRAMEKAKNVGIGWVLITNTTSPLAMGYYTRMAAKENMAGITITVNPPNMAPFGAKAVGLHNSPISISVPAGSARPPVLDMATSVAARGKIFLAVDKGISIPQGWALDGDGEPTTDPHRAEIMLPFAGPKGSGLSFMFECLASIMAGSPLAEQVLLNADQEPRHRQNCIVAAIDVATFTDPQGYEEQVDGLITGIKALPKAQGVDEIYVPGELEDKVCDERIQRGIPLPVGTVRNLRTVAERLAVELPPGLQ